MIIKLAWVCILEFSKHLFTTNITIYLYLTVVQIVQRSNYNVDLTNVTDYHRWNYISLISLIAVSFHSSPSTGYSSRREESLRSFTLCLILFLRFLLIEGITGLVRHLTLIENISVVSFVILMRVICIKNEWSLARMIGLNPPPGNDYNVKKLVARR